MKHVIPALFCALALPAMAETNPADVDALLRTQTISFRPADKQYPAELAEAGVQGEALIVVRLTADGHSDGASLGRSSRSAQLDRIALDLANTLKFQVKEAPAKGMTAVVLPVEFYRDSVTTLAKKTCAEFGTDLAYFQSVHPEKKVGQMRVLDMATGMLYFASAVKTPQQMAALAKSTKAAQQPTIDACAAKPDALFYETWLKAVKAAS